MKIKTRQVKLPDIVARCNKCGMGYVLINKNYKPPYCLVAGCGGMVRKLKKPVKQKAALLPNEDAR